MGFIFEIWIPFAKENDFVFNYNLFFANFFIIFYLDYLYNEINKNENRIALYINFFWIGDWGYLF